MGRKILYLLDNLTQQREGIRHHVPLAHLLLQPGGIGGRLERISVIGENDLAAQPVSLAMHWT